MGKADYLIIGQGLAGSCLALELLARGKSVLVTDRPEVHSASRVAAGMFNPITSKVKGLTWNARALFDYMETFYPTAEKITGESFYHPLPMYRPFPVAADQNGWESADPAFLKKVHTDSEYGRWVNDPFGGIELNRSGFVDTAKFTAAVSGYLYEKGCVAGDQFPGAVDYSFIDNCRSVATRIIFCEGSQIIQNPFFSWLPVSRLKGEVLETETDLPDNIIFNRSVYLVPSGTHFRAGSTYDRSGVEGNSEQGISDIEQRLRVLLKVPFKTTGKSWGFRPVVRDRRPVIGPHPDENDLFVFNGLGTKGVSLAPWCAARLADYVTGAGSLPDELNISRFYPLYFKYLQDSQ